MKFGREAEVARAGVAAGNAADMASPRSALT